MRGERHGLGDPPEIQQETERWKQDNDAIQKFRAECCRTGSDQFVPVRNLRAGRFADCYVELFGRVIYQPVFAPQTLANKRLSRAIRCFSRNCRYCRVNESTSDDDHRAGDPLHSPGEKNDPNTSSALIPIEYDPQHRLIPA